MPVLLNSPIGELFGGGFDKVAKNGFLVEADEKDFLHRRQFAQSKQVMGYDWMAGNREQGLNVSNKEKKKAFDDVGMTVRTFGTSKDNGRKRVPRLGPPTMIMALLSPIARTAGDKVRRGKERVGKREREGAGV